MLADFPTSPRDSENTSRYNPKIIERKLNPQTEWAELVRQQQYYAEKMIQQEKDKKAQQKAELNEALSSLIQDKETKKKFFTTNEKQDDFTHSMARKQEYDQYLDKVKNDKLQNQKALADDYSRKMWLKDEENKKKMFQEKQTEERMISDALDSLQREKMMKDKMRADFIHSIEPLMQEKEAQRRREQEKREQDRDEHRRLMDQRAKNMELQENNYKLYYQRINEKQNNRQQMWDETIGQTARSKDRNIDGFIEKGIEEARRKAELEELERQRKKQEQLRSVKESLQAKIQEQEDARMKEKLSYQNKVEELMRQNQQAYNFKEQTKKERMNHTMDYKNVLESQIREAEEQKRRFNLGMLEQDKKLHNNFDGLIPGIRNTKIDNQLSVQTRSARNLGSDMSSPYSGSPLMASPYTNKSDKLDSIKSPTSSYNPFNTDRHDHYNPITNPIPNTVQNPYLSREFQKGGVASRNNLASFAGKNLIG